MKVIPKLLSGNGVFALASANVAYLLQAAAAKTAADSGTELISEDTLKLLLKEALPNDFTNFTNTLAEIHLKLAMGLPVSSSIIYKLMADVNRMYHHGKDWDGAEKLSAENKALGEIAVDPNGFMYTADEEGNITKVHYSKVDASKLIILTNSDLLLYRKFSPTEVGDTDLINTVRQSIGFEKINEYILKILGAVGSTDNSSEAYVNLGLLLGLKLARRPTQLELESLLNLYTIANQLGIDAIFKVGNLYKSKNLEAGFKYLMKMLPDNMKNKIIATRVALGLPYRLAISDAGELLATIVDAANDVKISQSIDYLLAINKGAGTTSGTKEKTENLGVLELLVLGTLGLIEYNLTSSKIPSASMILKGSGVGSLATYDDKIVGSIPLSVAMLMSLAPIIDQNHMNAGDLKISSQFFDTIMYDGGPVINIWAPVDNNDDIDFESLLIFNEILEVIKNNPLLTIEDRNRLLYEHGIDGLYDLQGTFHGSGNMAQFLVLTGLTSDEVIDPDTNLFADKLDKLEKEAAFRTIERVYGQLNKGIKSKDGKYDFKTGWFKGTTELVKVPIFMKLGKTANIDVETFSGKGPLTLTPTYSQMVTYDQQRNPLRKLSIPSTSLLYE